MLPTALKGKILTALDGHWLLTALTGHCLPFR